MDKKYIIEHNLMEAHNQFMRLSEGYLATSLEEDGEDEMEQQDNNQIQPMDNPQQPIQNNQEALGQEQPSMDLQQVGSVDSQEDELDANVDDTVLDVEDLTQAQEKLNKKQNSIGKDLGEVDDRIIALLTAVEKIQGSLDKNNSDIQSLKQELEKRVPTQKEKLNMQSLKMYPYNVAPNDYWDDKEKDGVYDAHGDNDRKKEYKITERDVDDYSDSEIEHSFDDELNQTMRDIFRGF